MKKNIYVCTPSAPFDRKSLNMDFAINNLNKLGFEVTLSRHALENHGNTSASIKNRLDDLHEGFSNDRYDIVMASRGGWNSNELLPHIDYDLIKKNRKPFFGMSDMTTLCVNLYQRSGIQTVYGHLLLHFGFTDDLKKYQSFIDVVNNPNLAPKIFPNKIADRNIIHGGTLKGPLFGGNLAVLCWLIGTDYALDIPRGAVLFLEDDEETNGYYWQMYLNHLKQTGIFEKVNGIVFGSVLPETLFQSGSSFNEIIKTVFAGYDFPIYIGAEFGHIQYPVPIPIGTEIFLR